MSNWNDFNDAEQQQSFDLIPRNTAAKLRLTIKPGGFDDPAQGWTGGWATQSFDTGAVCLGAIREGVTMMSTPILTTSHYGVVRFGDLAVEAVVLEDGTRGYVQRQLATAIGLHESRRGSQLKTLLSDVAPGAAEVLQENACSIRLPSGQTTAFFPAGVISEVASGVIDAALEGRLHRKRQHLVPNCQRILKALAKTGEVALIDEATGYQ